MSGKYTPLEQYLRNLPATQEEATLLFSQIERIINDKLPTSAYEYYAWWANEKEPNQPEKQAIRNAGWRVDKVNLSEKWVRLVKGTQTSITLHENKPLQQISNLDIEKNIRAYKDGDGDTKGIEPLERYTSFDYCFNYFQSFREQNRISALSTPEHIQESCLQLGFYLASWGMLRGSSFLPSKSVKVFEVVIQEIVNANPILWEIDANNYFPENIQAILDFRKALIAALDYRNGPSDILITKIMLGVFGNVPAFDNYFTKGFGVSTFSKKALMKVSDFYKANETIIEQNRFNTLDFMTGLPTKRKYTRAKVIDMIFLIEGGKSNQ